MYTHKWNLHVAMGVTFGSQIITDFCGISRFGFRTFVPLSYRGCASVSHVAPLQGTRPLTTRGMPEGGTWFQERDVKEVLKLSSLGLQVARNLAPLVECRQSLIASRWHPPTAARGVWETHALAGGTSVGWW